MFRTAPPRKRHPGVEPADRVFCMSTYSTDESGRPVGRRAVATLASRRSARMELARERVDLFAGYRNDPRAWGASSH